MVEEADLSCGRRCSPRTCSGPVALTKALLPAMRAAGRGRIVRDLQRRRSARAAGHRRVLGGQGRAGAVGRVDGRRDRAVRARRHGPGRPAPTTPTSSPTQAPPTTGTSTDPTPGMHRTMDKRGRLAMGAWPGHRRSSPPGCARRWTTPPVSPPRGRAWTRRCCWLANRFLPAAGMHQVTRLVMGIPRQGAMRGGAVPLTAAPARDGRRGPGASASRVLMRLARDNGRQTHAATGEATMADTPDVRIADADRRQARRRRSGHLHQHQPRHRGGARRGRRRVEGRHAPRHRRRAPRIRRHRLVDQPCTAQALPAAAARRDRGRSGRAARGTDPRGRMPAGDHLRPAARRPAAGRTEVSGQADRRVPLGDRPRRRVRLGDRAR